MSKLKKATPKAALEPLSPRETTNGSPQGRGRGEGPAEAKRRDVPEPGVSRHLLPEGEGKTPAATKARHSRESGNPVHSTRFADLVECAADTCHPSNAETEVYVGLEHIDSGAFQLNRFGHPDNVTSAKTRFRRGDILYGKLRPYLDKAILADREGICSTDILVFRPKPNVAAAYALGLIHSEAFRDNATATTQGVNHPRTSWNGVSSFECLVPPKPEQQKIAAVLWKIQRAIATQDRLIAATCDLKQSAMQHLFTHGLRGEPLKDTAIGSMPKSWEPVTIGDIASVGSGGTPSRANPSYWLDGTIPWVKTGEVDYCVINDTEEKITPEGVRKSAAKIYSKGTLLMAMYGQGVTRGKVAILGIDASINQACAAIRTRDDRTHPGFLYYVLAHGYERLRGLAHGGQQQNLNADLIRGFPFGLPASFDEQRDIAAALATLDRKLAHHQRKRAVLNDLFQTTLHQMMTAQIRVADLDIDTAEVADHFPDAGNMVDGATQNHVADAGGMVRPTRGEQGC